MSKKGVKVYIRPEYHPCLRNKDLTHEDFLRKLKETFDRGVVKCLPKICSEHSEDAMTWHYFSPLLRASPESRRKWLKTFLETALRQELDPKLVENLASAELFFWHGREAAPYLDPHPGLCFKEGKTEVDLLIIVAPLAVVFVEAKYRSEIAFRTTHGVCRDQIIRSIDVGTYYARKKSLPLFYLILLTSPDLHKSIARLHHYKKPQNLTEALPHRKDLVADVQKLSERLGYTTWDHLPPPLQHSR